jgi:ribosomal-protein-alanine N-acetyltransferase
MTAEWPVTLNGGRVALRPLQRRDSRAWTALRRENADWLREWDATLPAPDPRVPATFGAMVRAHARDARAGRALSLALLTQRQLAGQITLGGIAWGSLRSAYIGYWIGARWAGQGLMPTAVALLTDYAFDGLGLHRVEINIRPENRASLRVVAKLGFESEGLRRRYLHINGDWRDHLSFAMLAGDRPTGGLFTEVATRGWRDVRSPPLRDGSVSDTGESVP